jgi:hypothetical protein
MRRTLTCAVTGLAAVLVFSLAAAAQGTQDQDNRAAQAWKVWKFHPMERPVGDGGPAPKRDLTGTWAGPSSGMAVPRTNARNPKAPPMTPLGRRLFELNKPMINNVSPANTNDPHVRYCDPYGFPQNMTNEIRGLQATGRMTTPSSSIPLDWTREPGPSRPAIRTPWMRMCGNATRASPVTT